MSGSKSYVTMEQYLCIVCGKPYDSGNILMDSRLKASFDMYTITDIKGMCEEHKKLYDDGYIALVEVANKSHTGQTIKATEANRTGNIFHIRAEVADKMFTSEFSKGANGKQTEMVFIDEELGNSLREAHKQAESQG